jgi:hypothetical protein
MILRLRHRASLQLLSLQHMSALPESMRQAASDRMLSDSESNINEILGVREQELRKAGLPLMHDKLAEVFVRTSAIAAGHRGAQHVIAALVETLQHAREKWLEDTVRGGADLNSWSHEVDHEQLSREGGYERAALVCLLYYAAQHYLVEGAANRHNNDHQRLVLQEQQVDNLRVALSGTPDDTAVALALFWYTRVTSTKALALPVQYKSSNTDSSGAACQARRYRHALAHAEGCALPVPPRRPRSVGQPPYELMVPALSSCFTAAFLLLSCCFTCFTSTMGSLHTSSWCQRYSAPVLALLTVLHYLLY